MSSLDRKQTLRRWISLGDVSQNQEHLVNAIVFDLLTYSDIAQLVHFAFAEEVFTAR